MYVTVPDYRIEAVNRARPGANSEESSIIYRDEHGELHKIDLAVCVENYCKERGIDPTGVAHIYSQDNYAELIFVPKGILSKTWS